MPEASPLSARDRDSWLEAAGQRNAPREMDVKTLRRWLKSRNPWKYEMLRRLIRWAEKQYFKEYGLYPEDARWMLP